MAKNTFNKLSGSYQSNWASYQIYDPNVIDNVDRNVQLHNQITNGRSSAASCINVLGHLGTTGKETDLISFLNYFGLNVTSIVPFPTGVDINGEKYNDKGNVVFEWIGPKESLINERGGKRGQNRTSIDAYILVKIDGKVTQLLIEWKFTETYHSEQHLRKFSGSTGIERLRRYSNVLVHLRNHRMLLNLNDNEALGLYDLGYEPYYQLLRMTLLAKMTTPLQLTNEINIEDYRIVHLTHSQNMELNTLSQKHLKYAPALQNLIGENLHNVWKERILSPFEPEKFVGGHWCQQRINFPQFQRLNNPHYHHFTPNG